MVAILSTPKPLPVSSIPRRPPSFDFDPVYRTTVEKEISPESRLARHFRWTAVVLYILLILVGSFAAVYYCANSATMDIRIPHLLHNESLSIANHRVMGRMKDSNLHFVQISFYAMARFQHPGSEVTVDSITVSVYNGATRVGGGEYLPSFVGRDYPFIHTEGDLTEITMLPKATLLEGEVGYKECSSKESSSLPLRLFFSILVHTKNFFGNEIKGRIEYSKLYSVCCSCQMKKEYLRYD